MHFNVNWLMSIVLRKHDRVMPISACNIRNYTCLTYIACRKTAGALEGSRNVETVCLRSISLFT